MSDLKITIVYDNRLHNERLKRGWGFSCLVEYLDKKVLFDTGDDPEKLSFNLNGLNINPRDIEIIALSHNHWDHTGGMGAVIDKNDKATVYFGQSYPERFKQKIKGKGLEFVLINQIEQISEGIFAGPEMGEFGPKEIPLTVMTNKGLIIITGCAHPGILNIVRIVKEKLNKNIYLILGGFHLGFSLELSKIIKGLKEMEIKKVAPCHCSGKRAINLFKEEFKEDFIKVGAGLEIEI
ncbi:MAG: MBL fold metallo-hydrolase [Candidatus Omnitrophica bacterium]|nr:MBL fold metallo-hydrolase [Candidatus Omnitrophota bacterium]